MNIFCRAYVEDSVHELLGRKHLFLERFKHRECRFDIKLLQDQTLLSLCIKSQNTLVGNFFLCMMFDYIHIIYLALFLEVTLLTFLDQRLLAPYGIRVWMNPILMVLYLLNAAKAL